VITAEHAMRQGLARRLYEDLFLRQQQNSRRWWDVKSICYRQIQLQTPSTPG